MGLGCGDPRDIEIVGDIEAGKQNWHFVRPFKKMTFASRMQHRIFWGPMKKPIEWSLKTMLAPWALHRERPLPGQLLVPGQPKRMMQAKSSDGPWGRLFRNWVTVQADANGYPDVGETRPQRS